MVVQSISSRQTIFKIKNKVEGLILLVSGPATKKKIKSFEKYWHKDKLMG